jgi:hypothetical protein
MRWGRIVAGAALIEILLVAAAVPLFAVLANPFAGASAAARDYTLFFIVVAVLAFGAGAAGGWWVARPLSSAAVRHGAWTGIAATVMYLVICSIPPNTVVAVFTAYGPFWFVVGNGLRIVGAVLGAAWQGQRRAVA